MHSNYTSNVTITSLFWDNPILFHWYNLQELFLKHESPTAGSEGSPRFPHASGSSSSETPSEKARPGAGPGAAFGVHAWAQETHVPEHGAHRVTHWWLGRCCHSASQVTGPGFVVPLAVAAAPQSEGARWQALGAPSCPPWGRGKGAQEGKSELWALQPLALQRLRCASASLPASPSSFNHILLVTPCKPEDDFIFNDSCTHFSVANVRREFAVAPCWYLRTFFTCHRRIDAGVFGSITFPFWNLLNAAHTSAGGILGPWLMWRGPERYIVSEDISRGSGGLVF